MGSVSVWATGIVILVGVCGFAFWKGGTAERIGATLILAANLMADLIWLPSYPVYPTLPEFGVDFSLAMALLLVAFRYSSLWLGGAMLLQSIALFSHAFTLGGDGPSAISQVWINDIVSNAMLLCIVVATVVTWRRKMQKPNRSSVSPALSMGPMGR